MQRRRLQRSDDDTRVAIVDGAATLTWNLPAGAMWSDIVRGLLSALPVGPGAADETCIGDDEWDAEFRIAANPPPGGGYGYLVRGVNECGAGSYGYVTAGGLPPSPRETTTCP